MNIAFVYLKVAKPLKLFLALYRPDRGGAASREASSMEKHSPLQHIAM